MVSILKKNIIYALILIPCLLLFCSCGVNNASVASAASAENNSDNDVIVINSVVESTTESIDNANSEPEKIQKNLKLVALGDSIPRGYGLDNPGLKCFPSQVAKKLKEIYSDVDLTNYAIDGITSSELLELMQKGGTPLVKNADIVIVCIGANNVLPYAFELIYEDNANVADLFSEYGKYFLGNKEDTSVPDALSDYFDSINSRAESSEFMSKIEAGAKLLSSDIPKIVDEIRSVNKDAKIYFTTIYSPYDGMNFSLPFVETAFKLGDFSDRFVSMLNTSINELAVENGYDVVDIYTLFKNSDSKNVNAGIDIQNLSLNFDPHPNLSGHTLIAEEYTKIITEDNT